MRESRNPPAPASMGARAGCFHGRKVGLAVRFTPAVGVAAALCMVGALVAGCSSGSGPDVPTIPRATAAPSPPATSPAGEVAPVGVAVRALVFDAATRTLVALAEPGDAVLLLPAGDVGAPWAPEVAQVELPAAATALAAGSAGTVLLAVGDQALRLDIAARQLEPVPLAGAAGDVLSVAELPGGAVVAGTATGAVVSSDGSVTASGMVEVDALAATADGVAALDQQQSLITEVAADGGFGLSLRAGNGASNLATDRHGRVLVAGTNDGELLVYSLDPLMLRQRFPVPDSPFGVAYDEVRERAWVTQTGRNEAAAYDLGSGMPSEVARVPTVRQPNSVAVDNEGGFVYIASAAGEGIQRFAAAQGR